MSVAVLRRQGELPEALSFSALDGGHDGARFSHDEPSLKSSIIDIRTEDVAAIDLRQQCLEGLRKPTGTKTLPGLLLWDEVGQSLYDEILKNEAYYLFNSEQELLKHHVHDLARAVADSGVQMLVELGAGNMHKTASILLALERLGVPLTYYALDVDHAALEQSIAGVMKKIPLKNVTVKGLCGTYEDGARWLLQPENHQNRRQAVLWLGSTIANFETPAASAVLAAFLNYGASQQLAGIILGIDSCHDVSALQQAYDVPDGSTRRWMYHALQAARESMGPECLDFFDSENWALDLRWEAERLRFENYLVATKNLKMMIGQVELEVEGGEHVNIIGSGKWDESQIQEICTGQKLQVAHRWKSPKDPYYMYWLRPTSGL